MADDLTPEERLFIQQMRTLKVKPEWESPEQLARVAKAFKGDDEDEEPHSVPKKSSSHHFPKFKSFNGEGGKDSVSWETFKFEVGSVVSTGTYTEEQIMLGIRQALKGKASDQLRILGVGVTTEYVLKKFESAYGSVENKETALRKFYTCEQKTSESVESFAFRLKDLFHQAASLGAFRLSDTEGLKRALHNGLRKDLKQMSVYQCDRIKDYDIFKMELRKIESEMAEKPEEHKPCKPAVSTERKDDSELAKVLKQLNDRIEKLEENQQQKREDFNQGYEYSGVREALDMAEDLDIAEEAKEAEDREVAQEAEETQEAEEVTIQIGQLPVEHFHQHAFCAIRRGTYR